MREDLNALAVFHAVMEERNVTAAARRLGLAQSTVSAALARLRETFGDELFVRARHGIVPTERALEIAPLGPDVDVRALADGGSDLALGRFAEPLEGFVVEQVLEDGLCCLVRADAVGEAPTLSREAFETLPHVVVAPPGRWRTGVFRTLEEAGLRRRVALTVSHFLAAPPAVKRTGAVATLPRRLAEPFGNDPELRVLAPPVDLGTFPMQMAWHPRRRRDAAHAWLRELVREACGTRPVERRVR